MPKTATSISIRDIHRRQYRRTMRLVLSGSVVLWFALAIFLANAAGGEAIVPMSIVLLVGLAVARVTLWLRYRREMSAELTAYELARSEAADI